MGHSKRKKRLTFSLLSPNLYFGDDSDEGGMFTHPLRHGEWFCGESVQTVVIYTGEVDTLRASLKRSLRTTEDITIMTGENTIELGRSRRRGSGLDCFRGDMIIGELRCRGRWRRKVVHMR